MTVVKVIEIIITMAMVMVIGGCNDSSCDGSGDGESFLC